MRWAIDSLVAIMISGVVAGVVLYYRTTEQENQNRQVLRSDVVRFNEQVILQSALGRVELSVRGFPTTIDPEWFNAENGGLPENPMIGSNHPWLEIAGIIQADLTHPPIRVGADNTSAKFWYNPYTGNVRARVPAGLSDADTLKLYNYVNSSDLTDLFAPRTLSDELAIAEDN